MISKLKEKKNQKGFTLMEMLIVVAIIVILVAIMIPTMSSQLEKAREAADIANIRSAYAEAMIDYLDGGDGTATTQAMTQRTSGWKYVDWQTYLGTEVKPKKGDTVTVSITDDATSGETKVTCTINASTKTDNTQDTQASNNPG